MSYTKIQSKEIVWCPNDDRYVYIKKVGDDVVGLNYCQGEDIDYFFERHSESDPKLTKFYHAIHRYLGGECELDRINQAIWAYVSYRND